MMEWKDYCDKIDCDDGSHNALENNVIKFTHGAAEYDITKFHSITASDLHGDSSFATTYVDGSKKTETDVFYCTRDKDGYLFKVKFLHGSNDDRQLIHYEALVAPPSTAPTAAPTHLPTATPTTVNQPTTAPTMSPTKAQLCAHVSCEYKTTKYSPKVPMMVVHADPDALTASHKCGWNPAAKKCLCYCSLETRKVTVAHKRYIGGGGRKGEF